MITQQTDLQVNDIVKVVDPRYNNNLLGIKGWIEVIGKYYVIINSNGSHGKFEYSELKKIGRITKFKNR